ncbi:hypothetical protein KIW84_058343 [Lathyrus oleraceus]|nr:hypothetical protein KIW84_058343 [Pisum sativum]
MEKLSSQQNLDTVYDLATEHNVSAREKIEELNNELIKAQEAARVANEQLISSQTDENVDFIASVSMGIEDVMSEVQNSKEAVQSVILMIDDATKSFSTLCHILLGFKTSISQDSAGQKLIFNNCQKLNSCLTQTIFELENQKVKFPFYYGMFLVISKFSGRSNILVADSSRQPVIEYSKAS